MAGTAAGARRRAARDPRRRRGGELDAAARPVARGRRHRGPRRRAGEARRRAAARLRGRRRRGARRARRGRWRRCGPASARSRHRRRTSSRPSTRSTPIGDAVVLGDVPRRVADVRRATGRRPPPSRVAGARGQDSARRRAGPGRRDGARRPSSCRSPRRPAPATSSTSAPAPSGRPTPRAGYHGGGALTRWVTDDDRAADVTAELAPHCASVRIMPFLDGVATSIHGIVLPDGVAVLRPVELVTLRQGHELRYSGCATFWDPPDAVRDEMRAAARAVGAVLRDDRRLPWRVHARRRGDGRRLPPDRAQPALRRRAQRHHARPGRRAAAARDRPRRRRPPARDQRRRPGGRDPRRGRRVAQRRDVAAARRRRPSAIDGARRLLRRRRLALGRRRRAAPTPPSPPPQGFARAQFDPARTPVGPSVGERSVAFWRFADREMGTARRPADRPARRQPG